MKGKQKIIFIPGGGGLERLIQAYRLHGQKAIYLLSGTKGEVQEFVGFVEEYRIGFGDLLDEYSFNTVQVDRNSSKTMLPGCIYYLKDVYAFDTTSNIENWSALLYLLNDYDECSPCVDIDAYLYFDFFISTATRHFNRFQTCWRWCYKNKERIPRLSLNHIKVGQDTRFEWILGLAYRLPGVIALARIMQKRHWQKKGQLS